MPAELHHIIIRLLKKSKRPLTVAAIHNKIESGRLWLMPSTNQIPTRNQISGRINQYPGYFLLVDGLVHLNILPNQRLLRLTWNENFWEVPMGHKWRREDQGNNGIAYEHQYGFGHEEWLFSPRFLISGLQYGYIRGLDLETEKIQNVERGVLYSVKRDNGKSIPYYVGTIDNIEVIKYNEALLSEISDEIGKYHALMISELAEVQADYKKFDKDGFQPVIRFKWDNVNLLEEPVIFSSIDLSIYKRFQPFEVFAHLHSAINEIEASTTTRFEPGISKQTDRYAKKQAQRSTEVRRIHSEIVKAFEIHVSSKYSVSKRNLSIEKTHFSGCIADAVLLNDDRTITICEFKTSSNGRRNIREAISQLLDYGLHSSPLKVKEYVIVSPAILTLKEKRFLQELQRTIGLPLTYMQYIKDSKSKFRIIDVS